MGGGSGAGGNGAGGNEVVGGPVIFIGVIGRDGGEGGLCAEGGGGMVFAIGAGGGGRDCMGVGTVCVAPLVGPERASGATAGEIASGVFSFKCGYLGCGGASREATAISMCSVSNSPVRRNTTKAGPSKAMLL